MAGGEATTGETRGIAGWYASPRASWVRWLGLAAGLALVAAAIIVIVMQREAVADALDAVRRPHWTYVAVLLGSVVANLALTGALFSVLFSRFGRVGRLEMQALIAAATLVNFLPLRPGLFGRVAYHKLANRIPARRSAQVIVESAVITAIVAMILIVFTVIARFAPIGIETLVGGFGAVLAVVMVAGVVRPDVASESVRAWLAAVFIRYVEVLIWSLRYLACFAMLDAPIDAGAAVALACVSVIATMVPLFSNGLGLREWAIGLAAPLLTAHQLEIGLTAELLNRAAEIIVILLAGSAGLAWLARLQRAGRADRADENGQEPAESQ